jgi:ketosteroid isomerase-like protein
MQGRPRATGTELDSPILQALNVKDGRITDVRVFYWDTACTRPAPAT